VIKLPETPVSKKVKGRLRLEELRGNMLVQVSYDDGSVEYEIERKNDVPEERKRSSGPDALDDILNEWDAVHEENQAIWRLKHREELREKALGHEHGGCCK
jgi:hypothetical protein